MQHYALYRKYRPKTFDDVCGQDHVTKTLKNQIDTGQFAHAYLFTGTRGTGKTSCARIFARAVNCLNPKSGEPCNECTICKGILNGEIYDVSEIDAASNNSVDNIRQLREDIVFTPVIAKYKVYIIDEVHMLSAGAFNALLKILEEPPSHAIFVLATTEVHKVPATILSRCQRFDMQRLEIRTLSKYLEKIVKAEKKQVSADIITIIATLSDGSARDGLSILEKVVDIENDEEIKRILGVSGSETLFAFSSAIARGDIDSIYAVINDFYMTSKDFGLLCRDLLSHFRFILITKTSRNPEKLIEKTNKELEAYKLAAEAFSIENILYIMECIQQTMQNLPRSIDKRSEIEVSLLRCAKPDLRESYSSLLARIKSLEDKIQNKFTKIEEVSESKNIIEQKNEEFKILEEEKEVFKDDFEINETFEVLQEVNEAESQKDHIINENQAVKQKDLTPLSTTEKENSAKKSSDIEDDKTEFKEFLSWDVITAKLKVQDILLSSMLSKARAIIKERQIILFFSRKSDIDMVNTPANRELISKALEDERRHDYSIKFEIGSPESYLSKEQQEFSDMYDKIKESKLFDIQ